MFNKTFILGNEKSRGLHKQARVKVFRVYQYFKQSQERENSSELENAVCQRSAKNWKRRDTLDERSLATQNLFTAAARCNFRVSDKEWLASLSQT